MQRMQPRRAARRAHSVRKGNAVAAITVDPGLALTVLIKEEARRRKGQLVAFRWDTGVTIGDIRPRQR